jgi:hypothetical protein
MNILILVYTNNANNSTNKGENFMKIGSENKWFYMKYIGKCLSAEILLTR